MFGYNHSIAYCLIGYICAWLRYYHTGEFIATYLNCAANEDDITWTTGNQLGKATCTFDGYTDDKLPYVTITVTEKNTGLTQTVHVRTVSAVRSVSLSRTRMSF